MEKNYKNKNEKFNPIKKSFFIHKRQINMNKKSKYKPIPLFLFFLYSYLIKNKNYFLLLNLM